MSQFKIRRALPNDFYQAVVCANNPSESNLFATMSDLGYQSSGTTSQYWRGDKTWQTLDKNAVGLVNVDNTKDINKPISTATQSALNGKQDTLVSGTNIKTLNGNSVLGSGNLNIGINFFSEAQSTAAPNSPTSVSSLIPLTTATNADLAIVPKAGGALLAAIPDGTFVGGNKRGSNALDLQMSRSSQVMVASGNFSAILGGSNNTAIGASSLAAGSNNSANGSLSFAIGQNNSSTNNNSYCFGNENLSNGTGSYSIGRVNNASGTGSLAIGGSISTYNTASATRSVAIGESNTASFTNAFAIGYFNNSSALRSFAIGSNNNASGNQSFAIGLNADTQGIYGKISFANGRFGVNGDAQYSKILLRCFTSGSQSVPLTSDGANPNSANQVLLPTQSAYAFKGLIVAKRAGSTDCAAWEIKGLIVRGSNTSSTAIMSSDVTLLSNIAGYNTPTLVADTSNGGLRVIANGSAVPLLPLRWVATIETTELTHA